MAKNVSLLGADYSGVPAVQLPQTGGGTATFIDPVEIINDNAGQGVTDQTWSANKLVEEFTSAEAAIAIVVDGDTAPKVIASGKYLFVKNHSTLARGLYKATAAIASGANVTSNNTEPETDGAANALNNRITGKSISITPYNNRVEDVSSNQKTDAYISGNVVVINIAAKYKTNVSALYNSIYTIPSEYRPTTIIASVCKVTKSGNTSYGAIQTALSGEIDFLNTNGMNTGDTVIGQLVYII